MKFSMENSLKEWKWDKKKNKMIDKDCKKRTMMMEDLVLNLCVRTNEIFKFCEISDQDFTYTLPSLSEKDRHFEAYQKTLLYLEGIYQYTEYINTSKQEDIQRQGNLKNELQLCKTELAATSDKLKYATCESDLVKKRCKDFMKQAQQVHEKCKLKKVHYKEVLKENRHLVAKNKDLDKELKDCESKIALLSQGYKSDTKNAEKFQSTLDLYKSEILKKTIEINLLEKINVEQAIEDENIKDKLCQIDMQLQHFKEHNQELYQHILICNDKETCTYLAKKNDISFKYNAAKNLIKRMQETMQKKNKELKEKNEQILILNKTITDQQNCHCAENQIVDFDGIIEENRRLWDGYIDLQMEQISKEQDLEITENKYRLMVDKLRKIEQEKQHIYNENEIKQEKIEEYQKNIDNLKHKHERLEQKLKSNDDNHFHTKNNSEELLQLKTFLEHQQQEIQENELKFISLQNEFLNAQDLLEDYKKSFGNIEELLDSKTLEHEEKISSLLEELDKLKNENDLLVDILGSYSVNSVVDVYIKMEELEESATNMMNLKNFQSSDGVKSNNNYYIQNNKTVYVDGNEELQNNVKNKVYGDLKCKIEDLRQKCVDSIDKIVQNADNKLEKYKLTLHNDENEVLQVETLISKTYENIKLQMNTVK